VSTMRQPANHHLAQLNIGRIRYEIDDPRMADFANNLALVNGLAERTPGFVWFEALERFVYQTLHKRFYGRRAEWFEHFEGAYFVMWWVAAGHRPSVEEAVARLDHLKQHGPSDHAFDWETASAQLWKTARCAPSESAA
jgi:hypothetical protein